MMLTRKCHCKKALKLTSVTSYTLNTYDWATGEGTRVYSGKWNELWETSCIASRNIHRGVLDFRPSWKRMCRSVSSGANI